MFVPGTPIPIAALRYRGAGIVIPPAQFPTALTPVLGTFAATGLAATGAVDGVNLVANGADWTGGPPPTGWVARSNASLSAVGGGVSGNALQVENTAAAYGYASQEAIAVIIGASYQYAAYHKNGTAQGVLRLGTAIGGSQYMNSNVNSAAWTAYSQAFTATSAALFVTLMINSGTIGHTTLFDSASCQQLRSISRFTLAPHGRVDVPITTPAAPSVVPFGLAARLAWPSCWYLRITPNTAGNDFEIVEVNAGVMTSRAATDLDFAASTEYTFGLQCMGNVIKGFVNNVEILSYTDPSWLWTDVPYWGIMDSAWPNGTFGTITGRA